MKESVRELMQRFSLEPLEDNLFRGQSEANGQRSIFVRRGPAVTL